MKTLINKKNITSLFGFVLLAVLLSSCNRGGYGCPYELEVASDILTQLCK